MRNGRFVLPVGDEAARLYLFVIRSGNAQAPQVFVNPFIRYKDKRYATLHISVQEESPFSEFQIFYVYAILNIIIIKY